MRSHKVRWLALYVFILLMSFVMILWDVKSEIIQLYQKNLVERGLVSKVENVKQTIMIEMQKRDKSTLQLDNSLLDTSSAMMYLSGFLSAANIVVSQIELLKVKPVSGVNVLPVKVSALGEFSTFAQLIMTLNEGGRPILLNDFSFKQDNSGAVVAKMQFYLFGFHNSG